ncbi:MAG: phosphatase PAP2 family protein [Kofleriaceae bacterium]
MADDRRPASAGWLIAAGACAVVAAISIAALDRPIARWLSGYEPSALWDRGIDGLEWLIGLPLAPPVGRLLLAFVLVGGMLATLIVPRWRAAAPAWIVLAATHVIARWATNHLKDATGRLRPHEWLDRGGGDTFGNAGGISFPSGHVALFASVAIPVAMLWPRTRPVLAIVAFAAAARIAVNAHFVSDALAAVTLVAAIAWALAYAVRPMRPPPPASPR